jgi:hypothetical protein
LIFFAILVVLVGVAVTLPIVYNLKQQLRAGDLESARQRWRDNGPADHDLLLDISHDREPLAERHRVVVRDGKAIFAWLEYKSVVEDLLGRRSVRETEAAFAPGEGEVLMAAPLVGAAVGLPAGGLGQGRAWTVPAIFDYIAGLLIEAQDGRNYLTVNFAVREGYPRRLVFVRRVEGKKTREEWNIYVWPAGTFDRQARTRERP